MFGQPETTDTVIRQPVSSPVTTQAPGGQPVVFSPVVSSYVVSSPVVSSHVVSSPVRQLPVTQQPGHAAAAAAPVAAAGTYIYTNELAGLQPPKFDWSSSDMPQQFKRFLRYCQLMLNTPTYARRSGAEQINFILLWLGPQGVEIYDNWTLTPEEQASP